MADDTKTLTRDEMIAHVDGHLGNPSNIDASQRIDWLNWALEDIASVRNWRSMKVVTRIPMVVGRAQYELDEDIVDITNCVYKYETSGYSMHYMTPDEFATAFPNPEETGQGFPRHYTWEANELRVYPFASNAEDEIEITVILWPTRFDTDFNAACPLRKLEPAIIFQAASYGAKRYSMWKRAAAFEREAMKIAKRRGRMEGEPKTWTPAWGTTRNPSYGQGRGVNIYISPQAT